MAVIGLVCVEGQSLCADVLDLLCASLVEQLRILQVRRGPSCQAVSGECTSQWDSSQLVSRHTGSSVTTRTTEVGISSQTKPTALCGMRCHRAEGHQGLGHERGVEVFQQGFGERRAGTGCNVIGCLGLPG